MFKKLLEKLKPAQGSLPDRAHLLADKQQQPVCFVRGEGARLWDSEGRTYLDGLASDGQTPLGHAHPAISQALSLQADKLIQLPDGYHVAEQGKLAAAFCRISSMDKALFFNTREQAITAAKKIARLVALEQGNEGSRIVFNTASAVTQVTDEQTVRVKFDDLDAVAGFVRDPNTCAVLIQTVDLERGVAMLGTDYLVGLRQLCDEHSCLMIVDESAVALGQTGHWFAFQAADIVPDVTLSGTGLANGLPLAICAARGDIAKLLSTHRIDGYNSGNAMACQIARTLIDTIEEEQLLDNAKNVGRFLKKQCQQRLGVLGEVSAIQGNGLLLSIVLEKANEHLLSALLERGLIARVAADHKSLVLSPPLVLSESNAREIAETIEQLVSAL